MQEQMQNFEDQLDQESFKNEPTVQILNRKGITFANVSAKKPSIVQPGAAGVNLTRMTLSKNQIRLHQSEMGVNKENSQPQLHANPELHQAISSGGTRNNNAVQLQPALQRVHKISGNQIRFAENDSYAMNRPRDQMPADDGEEIPDIADKNIQI